MKTQQTTASAAILAIEKPQSATVDGEIGPRNLLTMPTEIRRNIYLFASEKARSHATSVCKCCEDSGRRKSACACNSMRWESPSLHPDYLQLMRVCKVIHTDLEVLLETDSNFQPQYLFCAQWCWESYMEQSASQQFPQAASYTIASYSCRERDSRTFSYGPSESDANLLTTYDVPSRSHADLFICLKDFDEPKYFRKQLTIVPCRKCTKAGSECLFEDPEKTVNHCQCRRKHFWRYGEHVLSLKELALVFDNMWDREKRLLVNAPWLKIGDNVPTSSRLDPGLNESYIMTVKGEVDPYGRVRKENGSGYGFNRQPMQRPTFMLETESKIGK